MSILTTTHEVVTKTIEPHGKVNGRKAKSFQKVEIIRDTKARTLTIRVYQGEHTVEEVVKVTSFD